MPEVTVKEGETTVVPGDNFKESGLELLKIVDPDYVPKVTAPENVKADNGTVT